MIPSLVTAYLYLYRHFYVCIHLYAHVHFCNICFHPDNQEIDFVDIRVRKSIWINQSFTFNCLRFRVKKNNSNKQKKVIFCDFESYIYGEKLLVQLKLFNNRWKKLIVCSTVRKSCSELIKEIKKRRTHIAIWKNCETGYSSACVLKIPNVQSIGDIKTDFVLVQILIISTFHKIRRGSICYGPRFIFIYY